ncbi:hypothetical protein ACXR2T_05890 [Leucobacter sp. HY1910]
MTRLAPYLDVESYLETLLETLELPAAEFEVICSTVLSEYMHTQQNLDAVESKLDLRVRSLHLLYDAGIRDGVDKVLQDIQSKAEIDDLKTSRIRSLLRDASAQMLKLEAIEGRDAISPLLRFFKFAIDLRVIDSKAEHAAVLPLVSARFGFDDQVASGGHTINFQITPTELRQLSEEIAELSASVAKFERGGNDISVLNLEEH